MFQLVLHQRYKKSENKKLKTNKIVANAHADEVASNVQCNEETADPAARSTSLENASSESGVSCFRKRKNVSWAFCSKDKLKN